MCAYKVWLCKQWEESLLDGKQSLGQGSLGDPFSRVSTHAILATAVGLLRP